jgi:hypothetical protein
MPVQTKDATAAERKRRERENHRKAGRVLVQEWVPASRAAEVREMARKIREMEGK